MVDAFFDLTSLREVSAIEIPPYTVHIPHQIFFLMAG
jgi:hypothetical protein